MTTGTRELAKARDTLPVNMACIYGPYLWPMYTGAFLTPVHMGVHNRSLWRLMSTYGATYS